MDSERRLHEAVTSGKVMTRSFNETAKQKQKQQQYKTKTTRRYGVCLCGSYKDNVYKG